MVTWTQMYMPMGGLGLSALVALIPIIFFFVALAVLRLKGHVAGAITLILSILIAIFAFKMPIDMAFAAAGYGFIYGLWPIAWIIVAAVFLYKLTVASGQFDIIRSSVNHGGVMALFYYQALERNGRKTKGMIEADSARHARQLLRGKELIPVHIEARMNTSSGGMLQRRRHAQRQRLKSRLLQAMLYPLVLLVVATGVVTILLTAVVPKIIEQFDHLGHALPVSTRTLIAMSDALQASGVYWLAGLLGLLVLGQRLLKNPAMRLRWDKTLLRLPVIGRVARGLNTARFSRTLSILTASSVPLLEGIQTAAAVSANRYVEQQLLLAADRVREGSSLRAALAELRLFPPMMLYMIASGEQSGELETMLEQAAVNQEREFDTQVGLALGLFEPALVVMMAGVVLFIVIAILEPMLQLNNMVGM